MKIKLTQSIVNGYKIPETLSVRKQELVDEGGTGLYLLVTQSGSKTYFLRYRSAENGNKTTHVKLGRAGDITLAQAKEKVKQLRGDIATGSDPQALVRQKREEMTYGQFMLEHYFPYITPRRRNAARYRRLYETEIKREFADVKLNAISKRQVQAFHNKLHSKGLSNAYCNRFLQLIKSSINFGINIIEVIDIKNPAVGIPLFEEQSKERYLSEDELSRLIPILIKDEGQPAKMARFLLATGLRLGECMNCRWDEIDIEHRVMKIPSTRSKSKKTDSIPLNAAAIQVLSECDKSTDHPFINLKTGQPYTTISKSFKRLMRDAGLEDVTAHSLRHTAASMMINAGESLYAVQKVLRHSSSQVTEKYAHLSTQSVMAASDTISEQLLRAAASSGH